MRVVTFPTGLQLSTILLPNSPFISTFLSDTPFLGICCGRRKQRPSLFRHHLDHSSLFLPSSPRKRALGSYLRYLVIPLRHHPPLRRVPHFGPIDLSARALDLCDSLCPFWDRVVGFWHSEVGGRVGRSCACEYWEFGVDVVAVGVVYRLIEK